MGTEGKNLQVSAVVSRHNSDRDVADDALWDELVARITTVVGDPRYAPIRAEVW